VEQLRDRVAVVTGGGRGIGRAIAERFAAEGATIVVSSRTAADLDHVVEGARSRGQQAMAVVADATDRVEARRPVQVAVEAFGRVDIVVNNVGGAVPLPFEMTTPEYMEEAFHFNVATAHALNLAAVPIMLERGGGSIVNISSVMGRVAGRGYAAYGTAKAAMAHYTRLIAKDLGPKIRVNAIAAGSIATSALEIVMTTPELKQMMEEMTLLGRIGDVEEIAAGVVYLASPAGGYITGKVFEIDGGIDIPNLDFQLPDL
jgi:7-alpha-hydroxysteroid dehydrogenase